MHLCQAYYGVVIFCFAVGTACASPPSLVEVQIGKQSFCGKVLAHDARRCWLLARDGALHQFETERVDSFRQISPQFQGWGMPVVRDQLRKELGSDFAVAGTRHYLVCARSQATATQYAAVLEDLFRAYHLYFSVRGFKIPDLEFPLVAIVFPDRAAFSKYAAAERVPVTAGLRGYYLAASNRIALFEQSPPVLSANDPEIGQTAIVASLAAPQSVAGSVAAARSVTAAVDAGLQDTLIHEATHQMAFNTGLHTRVGANPQWVVEGLATVFEAPGIRNSSASLGANTRINPERHIGFGNYSRTRRKPKSLESFISGDDLFQSSVLDAYSQAWALTFFLIETRSRQYAAYLASIGRRNPLLGYGPEERLLDFRQAFGANTALLEAEFLRYHAGIARQGPP